MFWNLVFIFWNFPRRKIAATIKPVHLLALDIGLKRTGVAFGDTKSGVIVALDTLKHDTTKELSQKVEQIVRSKKIERIIIGLPLLLSGEEGSQVNLVRSAAKEIEKIVNIPLEFIDERYTTKTGQNGLRSDPDARAACSILGIKMDRKNAIDM